MPTAQLLRRFAVPALLLALATALVLTDTHTLLSLEAIQSRRADLAQQVAAHPLMAGVAFGALYTGAVALSLPVATVLTLLGGFLFGLVWGTLLVVTSATLGAILVFSVARGAFGEGLRRKAGALQDRFARPLAENPVGFLLFLRLVPVFPFFIVNIAPALLNVRLRTFAWTTALGILPGTAVYVNVGRSLGDLTSLRDLASPQTLLTFGLLGALALVPGLYKHYKNQRAKG